MKSKHIFQKIYTRDTTLIIQQLWSRLHNGLSQFNIRVKESPAVVDYINNGVIEVWENVSAVRHIKKELVKFCRLHPKKAFSFLKEYEKTLRRLDKIWKRGSLDSKQELSRFVIEISVAMVGDLLISYIGDDRRLSGRVKDFASRLRAEDYFFVNNNSVLRNTLIKIFPRLKTYVNVLGLEDIVSPPSLRECRLRFAQYIYTSDGYRQIESLKKYSQKKHLIFREEEAKTVGGSIMGQIANRGLAIGRAKIVFSIRDLSKVEKGDIIVAPMTTVDMLPAINRAVAVITDEGGIICHAAIVARELNKPCLISTKEATKLLKDGDLVEVNARVGFVRILKNYSKFNPAT